MSSQTERKAKVGNQIGSGSFGRIYDVTFGDGRNMVAKAIKNTDDGPPDLMEASIMSTYNHPGLTRSTNVKIEGNQLYIIQEKATSDLAKHTRGKGTAEPLLRSWSNTLCQAVMCLHTENIIHCDIKAANALRYEDNSVRLTDFTLAVICSDKKSRYNHTICTITHKPPECLIGQSWDRSVDIWSLACTLYEIAAGELLFPYQGYDLEKEVESGKMSKDKAQSILTARTTDCILDWLSRNGDPDLGEYYMEETTIKTFTPAEFNSRWNRLDSKFRSLVLSMLKFDPKARPTIEEVLKDSYFENIPIWNYVILSTATEKIPPQEVRLIEQYAKKHGISPLATSKLKEIYARSKSMKSGNSGLPLVMGAMWIACKIVEGDVPKTKFPKNQILEMERLICKHLKFRLHMASMDVMYIKSET